MMYFGCWNQSGHFLYGEDGYKAYGTAAAVCPLEAGEIDGTFAPRRVNEREEVSTLTHLHGWTVLAMWDRSVDKRGKSNAAFLEHGTLDASQMWELARQRFPAVVARLKASPFLALTDTPQEPAHKSS